MLAPKPVVIGRCHSSAMVRMPSPGDKRGTGHQERTKRTGCPGFGLPNSNGGSAALRWVGRLTGSFRILLQIAATFSAKPGHSGYPIFSGRVIRVIQNCYPILVPKKHYPQFRVSDNSGSGSGIHDLPEFSKNNTLHKSSIAIYI